MEFYKIGCSNFKNLLVSYLFHTPGSFIFIAKVEFNCRSVTYFVLPSVLEGHVGSFPVLIDLSEQSCYKHWWAGFNVNANSHFFGV